MPNYLTDNQIQYLLECQVGNQIIHAFNCLFEFDRHLLETHANERSITFRFATYLQSQLPDWTIDCEYNRDGVNPKKLVDLGLYPDSFDENAKTVYPDVIVHHRGTSNNLLVIEFKKSTNKIDRNTDLKKLRGYKHQLGYANALFANVGCGAEAGLLSLEWI